MKKSDKIQDSPEFKYLEANFSDFVKEMEEDKESADLKLPDGWEQDFARTMDETLDENERKRRRKIFKRIAGVAAAAVLVLVLGNFTAESVSGEGLLEMFRNQFLIGDKQHQTFGTHNQVEFEEDNNPDILYFDGTTLEEVNNQIRNKLKSPMFYFDYFPDGFIVEEASYDNIYRIINIKLIRNDEYIYIFQQKQIDDVGSGIIEDSKEEGFIISNIKLGKEIHIFESVQDNTYMFDVKEKNDVLSVDGLIPKEECVKIAENIDYK